MPFAGLYFINKFAFSPSSVHLLMASPNFLYLPLSLCTANICIRLKNGQKLVENEQKKVKKD